MLIINKLASNWVNRKDPKFIIIIGKRDDYKGLNLQSISFKKMDKLGITYEKFNSVMMVKHTSKELEREGKQHFAVER